MDSVKNESAQSLTVSTTDTCAIINFYWKRSELIIIGQVPVAFAFSSPTSKKILLSKKLIVTKSVLMRATPKREQDKYICLL